MTAFLFAPESPRPWALMRILLAAALLWDAATRWPCCVELYSSAGHVFPAFPSSGLEPSALDPLATLVLYSVLVVSLALLLIGWHSRLCALLAFVLIGWFSLLDAAGTLTKYTAISLHLLLLMSFAQPGGAWSIDAWRRSRRGRGVLLAPKWPRRLLGILVASIYLGAAITKIRLPDFATGDLLEFSLLDDAFGGRGIGLWLVTKPKLLVLASYAVIAMELLFPVLIWIPQLRRIMLALAIGFHLALAGMMHLAIFSPVMIAALFAFVNESDLQAIGNLLGKLGLRRRRGEDVPGKPAVQPPQKLAWIDPVLFGLVLLGSVSGLTYLQYRQDDYGVFHREVALEFPQIESDRAYQMIDAFEPEAGDFFHRIEIGSRLGYRRVYGSRETFRPGEVVYVMARLLQPHPSWELEWELAAPGDGEDQPPTAVYHRRLDASHSYASIGFQLKPEFPAGRYRIRLAVGEPFGAKEIVKEIPFELVKE